MSIMKKLVFWAVACVPLLAWAGIETDRINLGGTERTTWPTNMSELNNDAGFLTTNSAGVSTNLSDYNNDVPFATGTPVYVETDPVFSAVSNSIVYTNSVAATNDRFPLAHYQDWTTITGTPDTIAGYGITDAYTKVEADAKFATGTPVYVESDPVWTAAETNYLLLDGSRPIQGDLSMGSNSVADVQNIYLDMNGVVYFGPEATDNSWRITTSTSNLVFQYRTGGVWSNAFVITPPL